MSDRDLRELERRGFDDPEAAERLAHENCRLGKHVYIWTVLDVAARALRLTFQNECRHCGLEKDLPFRRIRVPRIPLGPRVDWFRPWGPDYRDELLRESVARLILPPTKIPEKPDPYFDDCMQAMALAMASATWKKKP